MIIKKNLNAINKKNRLNLTIGTFDALHRGHLQVLDTLVKVSGHDKAKSCVITFRNRPRHILKQQNDGMILSNQDRIIFFKKLKINYLFYLNFTENFAQIRAEDFIKKITNIFNINKIIVGNDFKFGYKNKGNIYTLTKLQKSFNFQLIVIKSLKHNKKKISSSLIKSFIKKGDIQKANKLLGREYFIKGKIIKGEGTGTKIGFPTVNLLVENKNIIIPENGAYISKIKYTDKYYYGMTYMGINHLTNKFVIETNIFNFNKKIYNKKISIFLIKKLRKKIKFIKLDSLKKQLLLDQKKAMKFVERINIIQPQRHKG